MVGRVADYIKKVVSPTSKVFLYISIVVIILMTLLVVSDVFMRRVFTAPIHGSHDLLGLGFSMIVFLPMAWAALRDRHIELDLITAKLPKIAQAILEVIMIFLGVIIMVLVTWRLGVLASQLYAQNATTAIYEISLYPFIYIATIGMGLLTLAFLIRLLNGINKLRGER